MFPRPSIVTLEEPKMEMQLVLLYAKLLTCIVVFTNLSNDWQLRSEYVVDPIIKEINFNLLKISINK